MILTAFGCEVVGICFWSQVVGFGEICLDIPHEDDASWMKVGSDQLIDGEEAEEEATDQTVSNLLGMLKPKNTSPPNSSGSVRTVKPGSSLSMFAPLQASLCLIPTHILKMSV